MNKQHFNFIAFLMIVFASLPKDILAQDLSLSELIKFHNIDNYDLNDMLVTKGWEFVNNEYGTSKWAFSKNHDRANAWFLKRKSLGRVYIQYIFCNTKYISDFKAQLKKMGFTKISTKEYNSSIKTTYSSPNYLITITYYAVNFMYINNTDQYEIKLEKRKTHQEILREKRELEIVKLNELKKQRHCEISKKNRDTRNVKFKSIIDSVNNIIQNRITTKRQAYDDYIRSQPIDIRIKLLEKQIQDSITDANRNYSDSIKAEGVSRMKSNEIFEEYGIANENTLVYESSDTLSKVQSVLYKNEKVKIVSITENHYLIVFDICENSLYDSMGYVKRENLELLK